MDEDTQAIIEEMKRALVGQRMKQERLLEDLGLARVENTRLKDRVGELQRLVEELAGRVCKGG